MLGLALELGFRIRGLGITMFSFLPDEDEISSQVSIESLRDKIELCEFEIEETKIQHSEQKVCKAHW